MASITPAAEVNASMQQGATQLFQKTLEQLTIEQKLQVWDHVARKTLKEMAEQNEQKDINHVEAALQARKRGEPMPTYDQLLQKTIETTRQRHEKYFPLLEKVKIQTQLWSTLTEQLEPSQKQYWTQKYHALYQSGFGQRSNPI
jgi:hypothetical protein